MLDLQQERRKARAIWRSLFPRGLGAELPKVIAPRVMPTFSGIFSDRCPDHFENIIIFGRCWKHNPDGSLKRTFAKKI